MAIKVLSGKKFRTGDEIKETVHSWLQGQLEVCFFFLRNPSITEGWQTCIEHSGGGRPALNVMGIMLRSDKEFSVISLYILMLTEIYCK